MHSLHILLLPINDLNALPLRPIHAIILLVHFTNQYIYIYIYIYIYSLLSSNCLLQFERLMPKLDITNLVTPSYA